MFKNKFLWISIVVILLIPLGYLGFRVFSFYTKGLAAPLVLELIHPKATPTAVTTVKINSSVPTPAPTQLAENCGHSGGMTFLFLARDALEGQWPGGNAWPYGADLIRLIRVDFSNPSVSMISVPRDLWVETPHLAALNIDHSRLGLVFYRIEQNSTEGQVAAESTASSAMAQAIYDNFGIAPDHYVFYDMYMFPEVIDDLGGLDVNVPGNFTSGGYTFTAGEQHFDGTAALNYARLENGTELQDGFNRFDRQNLIVSAIWSKVLEPANFVRIPDLVDEYKKDAITDMSPSLIADLSCLATKIPQHQLLLFRIDQSMITGPGPDSSMLPDVDKIKAFLEEHLNP